MLQIESAHQSQRQADCFNRGAVTAMDGSFDSHPHADFLFCRHFWIHNSNAEFDPVRLDLPSDLYFCFCLVVQCTSVLQLYTFHYHCDLTASGMALIVFDCNSIYSKSGPV